MKIIDRGTTSVRICYIRCINSYCVFYNRFCYTFNDYEILYIFYNENNTIYRNIQLEIEN